MSEATAAGRLFFKLEKRITKYEKSNTESEGRKTSGGGQEADRVDPARTFRLSDEFMANVDAWAAANDVSRSEAIRRLVELGLKAKKS